MKKAYKYRGGIGLFDKEKQSIFERDINTLANNQIYLPTKVELNDPTEGFYNDDSITSLLKSGAESTSISIAVGIMLMPESSYPEIL